MICRCDRIEDSKTRTASLVSFWPQPSEAFLVIPKRTLFDSRDGGKNNMWYLRQDPPLILRPQVAQNTNKVSLGFVEGFNNKIRVLQRRAYGLRDEEYLRLKVLTCMLPQI